MKKQLLFALGMLVALCLQLQATAQPYSLPTTPVWDTSSFSRIGSCGTTPAYIATLIDTTTHSFTPSVVTPYADSAIDTCGKFAIYYEDVNTGDNLGFDDPRVIGGIKLGRIRRNTYCQVLSYIQSVFDFSNVSSANLIKIHMLVSYADSPGFNAPVGTGFLGRGGPLFPSLANQFTSGYVNQYVTTGVDPAAAYHAQILMNFDQTYSGYLGHLVYQNDASAPYLGCSIDLYSVLLHETSHCLGWISLVSLSSTTSVSGIHPVPLYSGGMFSKVDSSMQVGSVFPSASLNRMIVGTPGTSLSVNPSSVIDNDANYWISNGAAPDNYPVFSGQYGLVSYPGFNDSYVSHMENWEASYSVRQHTCPGDRQEYVMGPFLNLGVQRRTYCKADIQCFSRILGYRYIGPDSAQIFGNHPPFSSKMAGYDLWSNYLSFPETVTADYTIFNNGLPLTINLASLVASGDLSDADGDTVRVDTMTLVNLRGCSSEGGNDHARLTVSGGNTIITYTPRNDFMGRAQIGFNLTDGKDRGSYYVITIDVKKGIYPAFAPGSNMVINPGFENGTEVKKYGPEETKPYTIREDEGFHEGRWKGAHFSDGHPYNLYAADWIPYGSGICINNSFVHCAASASGEAIGASNASCPSFEYPLPSPGAGHSYQPFLAGQFSYYLLADSLYHCNSYTLEFDVYTQDTAPSVHDIPISIGFKDDTSNFLAPVFNHQFTDTMTTISDTAWKHITVHFHYCGTDPSAILFIQTLGRGMAIDNLSLKPDTSAPPPLLVSVAHSVLSGCTTVLTASVTNAFCSVSYLWSATAATTLTASKDTVLTNIPVTYSVTVNDGCRSASGTYSVTATFPHEITGPTSVCTGRTVTLSDVTSGGVWTSSNTSIATVGSVSGVVTGVAAGVVNITYTFGCFSVLTITVNPIPAAITGTSEICAVATTTLADGTGGGTWSSGNTTIATVGSSSGVVTGVAGGTATISYTLPTGCFTTFTISVDPLPIAIGGTPTVCAGLTTFLTSGPSGGTWSSSSTPIATVASTGVVTGVSGGVAVISYTLGTGCAATIPVTVNPVPATISGPRSVCFGGSVTLTDATSGGTWTSTNIVVAVIGSGSGIVTGLATGITTIRYTLPTGCATSISFSVNPLPVAISGSTSVCTGSTITLTDGTTGGRWSSSSTSIATVGSGTGIVTGVSGGVVTISYTLGTGCYAMTTITVNPQPAAITGSGTVCVGQTTAYTDATTGGTWSSSAVGTAAVGSGTGIVTGVATGVATITYTLPTGCYITRTITVNPLPGLVTGVTTVCAGATTLLTDAPAGGTWTSGSTGIATVGSATGTVTGVAGGTATITYTLATGCYSTATVTVVAAPAPITGALSLCIGSSSTLGSTTPGGTWGSSVPSVATIGSSSGIVTGVSAGTTVIVYTLPSGCYITATATVSPGPAAITGITHICVGSSTTLTDATGGGTWSSSDISIAAIGSVTGTMTGIGTGTVTITYTVAAGCYTTVPVTVNPAAAPVTGTSAICVGSTATLTDPTPGGVWSSLTPAVGTIGSLTGIILGISTGIAGIDYTVPSTGCSSILIVTVNPLPAPITGPSYVCTGNSIGLADAMPDGTWSSSPGTVAAIGSLTGIVTGVSGGTAIITYTLGTGCSATYSVRVFDSTCSPCSVFRDSAFSRMALSGGYSGNLPHGYYHIANSVTITGIDTFTNAIILIDPWDTIYIDTNASLRLVNCHLFGACDMWSGIVLKPGAAHSGRLFVTGHSLIEDAWEAVNITGAVTPASGNVFESDDAIFNRNEKGIHIRNYTPNIASYPFLIRNTVITSRDFQTHNPSYPYNWPPMAGPTGLKTSWTPLGWDGFAPPYNIDNPLAGPYAYTQVGCKSGLARATYGIWLDSIGTYTASSSHVYSVPLPAAYAEIVIGDDGVTADNKNLNLFDNLKYAAIIKNTNLTCVNNAFINLWATIPMYIPGGGVDNPGGEGINANSSAGLHRLRVYSSASSPYQNKFYGFATGVECNNYFNLIGQNTYMISTNTGAPGDLYAAGGFYVKTPWFDNIDISYDTLTNLQNSIAVWMASVPTYYTSGGGTYPSQIVGFCNITYNTIQAHTDWSAPLGVKRVNLGIAVQNPLISVPPGTLDEWIANLNISANTIHDAYNGIFVNNFFAKKPYHPFINENTVYLRPRVTGMHTFLQYGINNTQCRNSYIDLNNVYGNMPAGSVTHPETDDSMRAYYGAGWNSLMEMGCNWEQKIGRGYEFFLNNPLTNWHDNHMQNNLKGMVLNGGVIGGQWNGGTATAPLPMNNYWDGIWPASASQTWVRGTNAASSPFYVNRTPATKFPTNNGGFGAHIFDYDTATNIFTVTSTAPICFPPTSPVNNDSSNLFNEIAQQRVDYLSYPLPGSWMGQYALWKTMLMDSTIADSSATLAVFATLAANSRYKYLTDIEQALGSGDFTTATTLLTYNIDTMANTSWDTVSQVRMADDITADYIVRNYQQFYQLYMNYATATLTGEDSLNIFALAGLCPEINGGVVYQARALYSLVYNDLEVFNDDSCLSVDSTYMASRHSDDGHTKNGTELKQRYSLYPNPNDGSFTLQQYVPDEKPVNIVIRDVVGREIYHSAQQFINAKSSLNIGAYPPGVYLLEITDAKKQIFRVKFVISK